MLTRCRHKIQTAHCSLSRLQPASLSLLPLGAAHANPNRIWRRDLVNQNWIRAIKVNESSMMWSALICADSEQRHCALQNVSKHVLLYSKSAPPVGFSSPRFGKIPRIYECWMSKSDAICKFPQCGANVAVTTQLMLTAQILGPK
jgi:hypothetical protein